MSKIVNVTADEGDAIYVNGNRITDRGTKWGVKQVVASFDCPQDEVVRRLREFGLHSHIKRIDTEPYITQRKEPTLDAAQADYEARYLAAIQPDPEPQPQPVAWPDGFFVLPVGGGARLRECATEGCCQHCSIRVEHGGIGSDYCEPCARKIAAPSSAGTVSVEAVMREIHRFAAERNWHPGNVTELVTAIGNLRALAGERG